MFAGSAVFFGGEAVPGLFGFLFLFCGVLEGCGGGEERRFVLVVWQRRGVGRCWVVGRGALGCLAPCWVGGAVPAGLGALAGSCRFWFLLQVWLCVWAALGGDRVTGPEAPRHYSFSWVWSVSLGLGCRG